MILWLASYPRSGNSLARLILQNLFSLPVRSVYSDRWATLLGDLPLDGDSAKAELSEEPCFVKTHEFPGDDGRPAIYLIRDGRDSLISYAHFVLYTEFGIPVGSDREAFLRMLRELIVSEGRFGGWSRHVFAWRDRPRTVRLRYEDLLANPAERLGDALAAIGQKPLLSTGRTLPQFESLHQTFPWFFRHGKSGGWRVEMPKEFQQLFWEHHGEAMAASGYRADGLEASVSCGSHPK